MRLSSTLARHHEICLGDPLWCVISPDCIYFPIRTGRCQVRPKASLVISRHIALALDEFAPRSNLGGVGPQRSVGAYSGACCLLAFPSDDAVKSSGSVSSSTELAGYGRSLHAARCNPTRDSVLFVSPSILRSHQALLSAPHSRIHGHLCDKERMQQA